MTIRRPRAIATLFLVWLCFGAKLANSEEINTGDSLDIAVFEWDREAGAIRSWETINNEYTVAEDGILYFPFIDGGIVAVGLDTNELASSLSSRLLESLSLPDLPAVQSKQSSTEPVSVYGFVRNTGRYDIKAGQTIREVFVAAGGSPIALNANPGLELSELTQRLDVIQSRRTILSARLARLRAEGEGAATLDFPEDVDPEVTEKQKREQKVFGLNRERTERQTQLLEGRIGLLTGEIGSLQTQLKNINRQLELAQEQLANINQLAERGLAVNARQLDALSLVSSLETRQLTLQLAVTEARQNLSVAELDLVDAQSGASASRLVAAQDVENQLLLLEDQYATLSGRAKILAVSLEPASALQARVWRQGATEPIFVEFDAPVMSGDIIEFRSLGDQSSHRIKVSECRDFLRSLRAIWLKFIPQHGFRNRQKPRKRSNRIKRGGE